MSGLRVLGVGSPGDTDRLGWQVIELLRQQALPDEVVLKACDRPGPALVTEMAGAEAVILIDALCGDCEPGTVVRLDGAEIRGDAGAISTHAFGVAEAIDLARTLGSLPPRLCVLGLCVSMAGSTVADAQLKRLAGAVVELIADWSVA